MAPHALAPLIFAPLAAFAIYRRIRSHFGAQLIRSRRMKIRIGMFAVFGCLLMLSGFQDIRLLEGALGGLLCGAALAFLGLRLTRFETRPEGDFYVPNPWIGGALTMLLVGRLAWRFGAFLPAMLGGAEAVPIAGPAPGNSPLTMLVIGLTMGYYAAYYAGLLIHLRRHRLAVAG
jgi:hypothetical protein